MDLEFITDYKLPLVNGKVTSAELDKLKKKFADALNKKIIPINKINWSALKSGVLLEQIVDETKEATSELRLTLHEVDYKRERKGELLLYVECDNTGSLLIATDKGEEGQDMARKIKYRLGSTYEASASQPNIPYRGLAAPRS